jgi:hypothetical protein
MPFAKVLAAGEVALMAGRQLERLNHSERRRLVRLLGKSRGRTSSLSDAERDELRALVAKLEPRIFVGSALKRLSPVPLPKRMLYGPRGGAARKSASERKSASKRKAASKRA